VGNCVMAIRYGTRAALATTWQHVRCYPIKLPILRRYPSRQPWANNGTAGPTIVSN
jgi:hypothetical protein